MSCGISATRISAAPRQQCPHCRPPNRQIRSPPPKLRISLHRFRSSADRIAKLLLSSWSPRQQQFATSRIRSAATIPPPQHDIQRRLNLPRPDSSRIDLHREVFRVILGVHIRKPLRTSVRSASASSWKRLASKCPSRKPELRERPATTLAEACPARFLRNPHVRVAPAEPSGMIPISVWRPIQNKCLFTIRGSAPNDFTHTL